MTFEIAIDIGGTFTDLYVWNTDGVSDSFKVPSTPDDPTEGLFDACEKAAEEYGMTLDGFFAATDRLVHGTTIATNAILEDEVDTTALITTEGFRDTLTLREGGNRSPYEWEEPWPEPYIPRWLTYEVSERVTPEGTVVEPLDEQQLRDVIETIRDDAEVEALAVSLLWSHVNPDHEKRIGALVDELAPDLDYSLSHRVNPIIREYRRTASTAINASLYGPISNYLSTVSERLEETGYEGDPLIITANGGVMQIDEIVRTPIWVVDSGPTVLPVAARYFTQLELDRNDVLALDMGGTSLDMSTVTDGTISRTRDAIVGDDMLGIEKVKVRSIGSGGGSIAWVDEGGLLRVGPQSAGADPGPVCYGHGGTTPTVTDAAVVLGYLNPEYFLGGEMTIDREAAVSAIDREIGDPLGLGPREAAHAIYATANQVMVNGIKRVTVERGVDPRKYVMAGGGGALGVHAVELARELRITDILLPNDAGVVSSIGGVVSDIRRDFSGSYVTRGSDFDHETVNRLLASLTERAREFFDRTDIEREDRSIDLFTEARYPHQVWELEVGLPASELTPGDEATLTERFHDVHEDTYGFRMDQDVEFLYWRAEATGETAVPDLETAADDTADRSANEAQTHERDAYFDGEEWTAPAYRSGALTPTQHLEGPAFVDARNTTIVLPPDSELEVTTHGQYHITP